MPPKSYTRPSSSFGYWRGGGSESPQFGGQTRQRGYGPAVQGAGMLPPGSGQDSGRAWTPTVVYLFVLILAEMVVFKILERVLR